MHSKSKKKFDSTQMCINTFFVIIHLSITMEESLKPYIKFRLATCFRTILKNKKSLELKNKANNIEDLRLVASMRQLEAESGLSYTIIQKVSVGKRDLQFTSLIALIESLGISFTEFAQIYDAITEKQMAEEKTLIEENRTRKKGKKSKK